MLRPLSLVLALGLIAGAAHAQEREWSLDTSDQDAYLIFGVPETDDVGVSLWCPIGKGVVNLFVPVPVAKMPKVKNKVAPLTVTVGKETATFRAKADVNPESVNASVEAEIPAESPLLKAPQTADRFSVKAGSEQIVFPLYAAELGDFLALCRKGGSAL